MAYEPLGDGVLDYLPCRYGKSKLLFRGPKCRLDDPYVAVLGGTETYGRFLETPYPTLLQDAIGRPVVNFGCANAGTDVYMNDQTVLDACSEAAVTVIQLSGVQNMSNRFYAVHPRRNDRFLRAAPLLKTIYREIDFTDFHFTRHLLSALTEASPEKFEMVRTELCDAWVARMKALIARVSGRVVLLWLADHAPAAGPTSELGADPLFVDRGMIDALGPYVSGTIEVVAAPDEIASGLAKLHYSEMEAPAAREVLGPVVHARAAASLAQVIAPLLK